MTSTATQEPKPDWKHAETLSGTCHIRHALWTGITAKKPGVLDFREVWLLPGWSIGSRVSQQQPVTILAFYSIVPGTDHFSCNYVIKATCS